MPVVQKFEIAKVLKLRQKSQKQIMKRSGLITQQGLITHFDVERLTLIKEKSKLIWTFIFFEIIVKIQMCTLFLFKKIKDARLFSNS